MEKLSLSLEVRGQALLLPAGTRATTGLGIPVPRICGCISANIESFTLRNPMNFDYISNDGL